MALFCCPVAGCYIEITLTKRALEEHLSNHHSGEHIDISKEWKKWRARCSLPSQTETGGILVGKLWHPNGLDPSSPSKRELEPIGTYIPQLKTQAIDHLRLVAEVKGIYAGLVMVESKCIEVDNAQNTQKDAKLNDEQWQALIALHRTLLHEHHDFFLASQHPTASSSLRRLGTKYYMPGRMWKHGIHAFLELLRHRLPDSLEHMLTFIYLAYSMIALLYETVPAFQATWMECMGDLGRFRMAIEDDDLRDREVWTDVSRRWYSKASDLVPGTGRLYHHLAILARPNVLQQLFYYSKAISATVSMWDKKIQRSTALESIMTLFDPLLDSNSQRPNLRPIDVAFVKAHGLLFTGKTGSEYDRTVAKFFDDIDDYINRTTRNWMQYGYWIAISNCCALLSWGEDSFIYETIRPKMPEESVADFNARKFPDWPGPNKKFQEACRLAKGTYGKVFCRLADPNILPFLHSTLLFYRFLISYPSAMDLLESTFPWKLVSILLNSIIGSYREYERIQRHEFPRPDKELPRPLPDDFALRGLLWADKYFPSDWFSNDKIDDDEKYFEVASMTDERKERILWLSVSIAQHGKWLLYDDKKHQFSVPSRFEEDIDINMSVDTDPSRAPALSSAGDDADVEMTDFGDCTKR